MVYDSQIKLMDDKGFLSYQEYMDVSLYYLPV